VDVGAGTGLLMKLLIDRLGPTGTLINIDISPHFITMLKDRAQRLGVADQVSKKKKFPLRSQNFFKK
jgi:ubiquinone/menaquinone biosynthesis C-methylase UbiE